VKVTRRLSSPTLLISPNGLCCFLSKYNESWPTFSLTNLWSLAVHRMHRNPEHVIQFLFAELGTSGSVDGAQRLIIKGRFQQKQIENVLRHYIVDYVTCKTCKSPDTILHKDNRLYFVQCEACGSSRSVTAIKTGFKAQTKEDRRAAKRV
jgi:putative translation initiation factor aIF-2 beta subunit